MDLGMRGATGVTPWVPSHGLLKDGSAGKRRKWTASSGLCTAVSYLPLTGVEKPFSWNQESAGALRGVLPSSATAAPARFSSAEAKGS